MVIKRKTETTIAYYKHKKAIKHLVQRQGSYLSAAAECTAKSET